MSTRDEGSEEPIKIGDLTTYSRGVNAIVKVISKTEPREVTSRSDASQHKVCEALVGDETGTVYMSLWDEAIDEVTDDLVLSISNGYVNLFRGSMRLNIGRYGSYEVIDEAPFDEVNLDNNLSSKQFERPQRGRDRFGGRGRTRY